MIKNVEKSYSLQSENSRDVDKIKCGLKKVRNEKDLVSVSGGISFQNKKIISLLLAGVSISGNLQQVTYAVQGSIIESDQSVTNEGQESQEINQGQVHQTANQDQGVQSTIQNQEHRTEDQVQGNQIKDSLIQMRADVVKEFTIRRDDASKDKIEIPEGIKKLNIETSAFWRSKLQKFEIPDNAGIEELNIEKIAFALSQLTEFKVPKSVTKLNIGTCAFSRSKLQRFEIPDNLDIEELNIKEGAFAVSQLTEFKVPKNVKKLIIGKNAFRDSKIQTVEIPGNVRELNIEDEVRLEDFPWLNLK